MAIWFIVEGVVIFAHVASAMFFLLLRFLSHETFNITEKRFEVCENSDFIDSTGLLFAYFKAILTPFFATSALIMLI